MNKYPAAMHVRTFTVTAITRLSSLSGPKLSTTSRRVCASVCPVYVSVLDLKKIYEAYH